MKRLILLLLCSVLHAEPMKVDEVVLVYDGDTFKINMKSWPAVVGKNLPVRVRGIDTPEIHGKCLHEKIMARLAREEAEIKLMYGGLVELDNIQRGKYFRLVADVYVDGESLGERLIRKGLARPYDGKGKRESWCGT